MHKNCSKYYVGGADYNIDMVMEKGEKKFVLVCCFSLRRWFACFMLDSKIHMKVVLYPNKALKISQLLIVAMLAEED